MEKKKKLLNIIVYFMILNVFFIIKHPIKLIDIMFLVSCSSNNIILLIFR